MRKITVFMLMMNLVYVAGLAQQITYSEKINKDRSNEMVFEIIGKYNNNYLIYKNSGFRHFLTIYNNDLTINKNTSLDFIPDRTMNVDFVPYKSHFFMIYQYHKKGIVHCTAVKFDSAGNKVTEPKDIDTTHIGIFGDIRIYNTVLSEDKQRVLVYKLHKKDNRYSLATMLYDNELTLQKKSRMMVEMDDRKKVYSDLQVDNEGNLVFTESTRGNNREYMKQVNMVTKKALSDSFSIKKVDLDEKYIDEVSIKVDNLNNNYVLNTFYYKNSRGSIEGLATAVYSKSVENLLPTSFLEFDADLRNNAKRDGLSKFAFDDYFIRNVVLKKDGGFILTAEDYSSQTRGTNNWNRWDYLFNSPYYNNYYYFNNPSYYNYYRPFNLSPGNQSVRHFYDNILILSVDKDKRLQWGTVIEKEQFDDDTDSYLSYSTMVGSGQIHFLFNDNKNNQLIVNHSVNGKGEITRNPTLKSREKGYQFMSRYARQTGASEMIIPCTYRGYICFAKVIF